MQARGIQFRRKKILPDRETRPLFCDLWEPGRQALIETKSESMREAIRMAIGQLADYARFIDPAARAVLLPEEPSADLMALLRSQGIHAIWQDQPAGFRDSADGVLVAGHADAT